jgi:hypothetical protein
MKHLLTLDELRRWCAFAMPLALLPGMKMRRECERVAVDIAVANPELGVAWIGLIVKRAYFVAAKSCRHTALDLMERLASRARPVDTLRDPELAIPDRWAR